MAIGPDGERAPEIAGGGADEAAFLRGLEGAIDRALARNPPGEPFVFGIHQEMTPASVDLLRDRYLSAGWSTVTVKPGATGAYLLVLSP